MPSPRELPIYELESAVVASLRTQGRLIVQAPTGSGKSTLARLLYRFYDVNQGAITIDGEAINTRDGAALVGGTYTIAATEEAELVLVDAE